jgi:hypothetical protein
MSYKQTSQAAFEQFASQKGGVTQWFVAVGLRGGELWPLEAHAAFEAGARGQQARPRSAAPTPTVIAAIRRSGRGRHVPVALPNACAGVGDLTARSGKR